jgi:hypothetical protein
MTELQEIQALLESALSSIHKYTEKPTKAESKRIRTTLGSIKNKVTPVRAILVAADKG